MREWNNLSEWIVTALKERGYTEPTKIQSEAIPVILEGKDVLAGSETGSGKTLAFGLPALEMIDTESKGVEVLVICPTRELAIQVNDDIKAIAKAKDGANVVPVYGGSDFVRQIKLVKKNAKIVVGTPGRLIDHIERRTLRLKNLKMVVLDEADEMLNMGFKPDIDKILKGVSKNTQIVMFSATLSEDIKKITLAYQKNAVHIQIGKSNSPIERVRQSFVYVGAKDKKKAFMELMNEYAKDRKIVFCNTKKMTQTVYEMLKDYGFRSIVLHGDMDQKERKIAMEQFKSGKANTLIATDVAGRGIDVKDLTLVINFDMPTNSEPYIHRIGRTGRAGKDGEAITIINNGDGLRRLRELASSTGTKLYEKIVSVSVSSAPKKNNLYGKARRQSEKKSIKSKKTFSGNKKDFGNNKKGFSDNKKSFDNKSFKKDRQIAKKYAKIGKTQKVNRGK